MFNLKKTIKSIVNKLFYTLFPELCNSSRLQSTALFTNEYGQVRSDINNLHKYIRFLYDYLDRIDHDFLKAYDTENLPSIFKERLGYPLKLSDPKTFNEKLQWLKINLRKPEMTIMADKYRVREYLKLRGYGKYLNQLYGVYNNINEVKKDWVNLPEKFVLKVNHWSGGNVFVKNKHDFNFDELDVLEILLQQNYYYKFRCGEWPYKDIQPCIIAEELLEDETGGLVDYKVFCFNGRAHFVQVDLDRFTNHTRCFYDLNWVKQPFAILYPLFTGDIPKPSKLEDMITLAEALSQGYPHIRLDFYIVHKKLFFGEFTFTHESGYGCFYPEEWDRRLGELIKIDLS